MASDLPKETAADIAATAAVSGADTVSAQQFVERMAALGYYYKNGQLLRIAAPSARKFWHAGASEINRAGVTFNRKLFQFESSGEPVPWELIKGAAEVAVQQAHIEMGQIAESVGDKTALRAWYRGTAQTVKDLHIANGALAKGGWFHMSPFDYEALQPEIERQLTFLRGFANDVARGRYGPVPSDNRLFLLRQQQYANAGRSTYENRRMANQSAHLGGRTESQRVLAVADHCAECEAWAGLGWMPTERMASEFPIGSASCRSSCHCVISTRRAEK